MKKIITGGLYQKTPSASILALNQISIPHEEPAIMGINFYKATSITKEKLRSIFHMRIVHEIAVMGETYYYLPMIMELAPYDFHGELLTIFSYDDLMYLKIHVNEMTFGNILDNYTDNPRELVIRDHPEIVLPITPGQRNFWNDPNNVSNFIKIYEAYGAYYAAGAFLIKVNSAKKRYTEEKKKAATV